MKDAYSFDIDFEGLDVSYQKMFRAYSRVFERCGVPTVPVLADSGAIGGKDTHEFVYLTESGEDSALLCDRCGYAANAECADFQKVPVSADSEQPLPVEEIPTPGIYTIEALADHLGIPQAKTCKAVFYSADGRPLFVAIRGDMEVNETKLRRAAGCVDLHYMTEVEVIDAGFVPGSASAVGLANARIVADDLLPREVNLVAGANKPDTHLLNVNYGRDWQAEVVADIALARDGYLCAQCGASLRVRRGIEMGQIFKLGTVYSEKLGATFLDRDGQLKPVVMGCYGIGTERLLAAVVEANHDEHGILWPQELAPYQVHLVALGVDRPDVAETADRLCDELQTAGITVLYDDREESPGVKFNDADLLGMPLRLTVSARTLAQNSVELKRRAESQSKLVPLADALGAVREAGTP
jgi:prolyl-tRNA synthetase